MMIYDAAKASVAEASSKKLVPLIHFCRMRRGLDERRFSSSFMIRDDYDDLSRDFKYFPSASSRRILSFP